jgi:hypothetical protein
MSGANAVDRGGIFGSETRYRFFTGVKYLVYLLLTINVFLFLQEELAALQYTFTEGVQASQLIQVFSATIDTAAWVILLLLFELETSVLDDSRIRGSTRYLLHGIRGICSIAIVYAFTGYYAELTTLYQAVPWDLGEACALLGQEYSVLVDLDDYVPLDAVNCAGLGAADFRLDGFSILAPAETLHAARLLAWTDVLNAGAWILVVVVLEVEVRLQLRGNLSERIMAVTRWIKYVLYSILVAAAIYWGIAGDFIDVWDAGLWLFAFIFIELNVFEWQYETSHEAGGERA